MTTGTMLEQLRSAHDALAAIDASMLAAVSDAEKLEAARLTFAIESNLAGLRDDLIAAVEADETTRRVTGQPTSTWIRTTTNSTQGTATRLVKQATATSRYPALLAALREGSITDAHRHTALTQLEILSREEHVIADPSILVAAEQALINLARDLEPRTFKTEAARLTESIAARSTNDAEEAAARATARVRAARSLSISTSADGHTTYINGTFATVDALNAVAILNARAQAKFSQSRDTAGASSTGPEAASPDLARDTSPATVRKYLADAFLEVITEEQRAGGSPMLGGDRPRIVITADFRSLLAESCQLLGITEAELAPPADLFSTAPEPAAADPVSDTDLDRDLAEAAEADPMAIFDAWPPLVDGDIADAPDFAQPLPGEYEDPPPPPTQPSTPPPESIAPQPTSLVPLPQSIAQMPRSIAPPRQDYPPPSSPEENVARARARAMVEALRTTASRYWHRRLDNGHHLSALHLRLLACDAEVMFVDLDEHGLPRGSSPRSRVVGAKLRRELAIRDRGCVYPGCTVPAAGCESHHIEAWALGGPTTMSNLVLLCAFHHREVQHDAGDTENWRIRMTAAGLPELIPPLRVDPDQRPVIHDRFKPYRGPAADDATPVGTSIADDESIAGDESVA